MRHTQANNTAVANFSVAVDSGYGENKKTNFFNMTAWGKSAETLERLAKKGTKLILECQAMQNQYTDNNGNKVNAVDFNVLNWEFAESKNVQKIPEPTPNEKLDEFMNIPDHIDAELPFA